MLSLITPVIKGYGTDRGYEVANNMQQVFGGHGYIEESGMSQFVRDSRIAMIYEGTNGVQAMDLCGRKLGRSEEHTSELQSLMRISYAVFCLKKTKLHTARIITNTQRKNQNQ